MSNSAGPKITKDGLVLDFDAANYKSYPAAQDTYVNNVSLMLDGESLTDKSQNAVTVTVQGAVTVDSSVKKIGNSSLKFAGALTDYLTVPSSSLFAFPEDFTIEFWTYANQWGQRNGATIYFSNGTLNEFQLGIYPSATQINLYFNGSSLITASLSASVVGRWVHIALVRSGSTITIYENGTAVGSGTSSYSVPASICYIGRQLPRSPIDYGHNLDGYIDDLRVTKSARYTANFTPSTRPLSLPGVITDLTKNKNLGTFTNGPTYSAGSLVFDGVNDYVNIPASTNLTFGTGDFTMELWFKTRNKTALYPNIIGTNSAWASNVWSLTDRHANLNPTKLTLHVYNIGNNLLVSNTVMQNNIWYHLVITRNGSTFSMYLNGLLESTGISTNSFDGGVANNLSIGIADASSNAYDGNIPLARIYKARGLSSAEVYNNFVANRGRFGV